MLNSWLHLLALVAYLGSVIGLWLLLLPSISLIKDPRRQQQFLARGLKLYNPIQIGALGVVVLSGAFQLTALKAAYREQFLSELGFTLGVKLLLSFFLILLSVYQSLGVAHRFVRRHERGEFLSREETESLVRRLKSVTFPILLLAAFTLWLGVEMRR